MPTLLLTHPACLEHDTGHGHPERADRLRAIYDALDAPAFKVLKREEAPLASLADIERLHPQSYVEMVKAEIPQHDHNWLDPDNVVYTGRWDAALRAAGAGSPSAATVWFNSNVCRGPKLRYVKRCII